MKRLNAAAAVAQLDEIGPGDPEGAHGEADAVLLSAVHESVRDAYERCVERVGAWWYT